MRRPLALIGLTSMLVLTVCFYAHSVWINWIFWLSVVGLAVSLGVRKFRKTPEFPAVFAVILISVLSFTMFTEFYVKPIQDEFGGKTATVTATLLDEPEFYKGKQFCTLKTETINGENKSIRMMLRTQYEFRCEAGDILKFTADLESTDYGENLADKIYINAYTYENVEVIEAGQRPLYFHFVKLRQHIRGALYSELHKDTADLASAVLLGDDSFSDETYEALRRSGLTHMVVVSGLHLSILTMLYSKTFGKLTKNKYINALVMVLIVIFFLCLTGFGKSSIRAAIMLFVLIASRLFKREGDSLNSLGFAAILLCLNPYIVGDVGVLLSFSATFGILVFSPPLERFFSRNLVYKEYVKKQKLNNLINRAPRNVNVSLATVISAAVCTLPVNVLFFGRVSLVQIFANLLVVPLVQWFMLFAALCAAFHFTPVLFMADLFAFIANITGEVMLYIARLFASLPMAYVKADFDFVILWISAVIILFVTAYFLRRNGKGLHLVCIVMSVLILVSGALGHIISSQNKLTVYVTPSKNGQSIIFSSKDGNVLIDSTDNIYTLTATQKILEGMYTEKQLMVIPNETNKDSDNGLFDYKDILMYDKIKENDCQVLLWDKASLSVFDRNSMVYCFFEFADTSVLILPDKGDAEDIPTEMRTTDVLITSGLIDNMEILSFKTLISNGNEFEALAVIDYFRDRDINSVSVSETINFDIVG